MIMRGHGVWGNTKWRCRLEELFNDSDTWGGVDNTYMFELYFMKWGYFHFSTIL